MAGHPTILRFALPAGLVPVDGEASPAEGGYRLWEKELLSETSGEVVFVQKFQDVELGDWL